MSALTPACSPVQARCAGRKARPGHLPKKDMTYLYNNIHITSLKLVKALKTAYLAGFNPSE